MRTSLKKESSKTGALQAMVTELEEARNASRKGEGEKGVMLAQLREQVHSWKSKAEKRKEKLTNLAKELTIAQQALDKATSQGIQASEAADAQEEDSRMWKLVRWNSCPASSRHHVCFVLAISLMIIPMLVLVNR